MKGENTKCKKDHDCKHTAKEVGRIQTFIANNIIKREFAKGHGHPPLVVKECQ